MYDTPGRQRVNGGTATPLRASCHPTRILSQVHLRMRAEVRLKYPWYVVANSGETMSRPVRGQKEIENINGVRGGPPAETRDLIQSSTYLLALQDGRQCGIMRSTKMS